MKAYKLEIQNTKGEIISEENLTLSKGDKLIIKVPDNATLSSIERIFDNIKMMMENEEMNSVILPESVKLSVLKIN